MAAWNTWDASMEPCASAVRPWPSPMSRPRCWLTQTSRMRSRPLRSTARRFHGRVRPWRNNISRPCAPYYLGGPIVWEVVCNGGLVAFEIARLLEADGELVDRLVLVAATAPRFELRWLDVSIEAAGRWRDHSPEATLDLRVRARDIVQTLRERSLQGRIPFLV